MLAEKLSDRPKAGAGPRTRGQENRAQVHQTRLPLGDPSDVPVNQIGGVAAGPFDEIGPYRIDARLGRGGMGEVYRGFDQRLERTVALKRLLASGDGQARERFRREARSAARVSHSTIVRLYDWIETESEDWIVMELVEGRGLHEILAEKERLTARLVAHIGRQIAAGLAAAHQAGLVHRDLKTENVMLTSDGEIRILDFGLAKRIKTENSGTIAERISRTGEIVGTATAMSPEQALGHGIDHRSDLFSLGSLLYELLSGSPPFAGNSAIETLTRICTLQPEPLAQLTPDAPEELTRIIECLLEKDPMHRPACASPVAEALDAIFLETTIFEFSSEQTQNASSIVSRLAHSPPASEDVARAETRVSTMTSFWPKRPLETVAHGEPAAKVTSYRFRWQLAVAAALLTLVAVFATYGQRNARQAERAHTEAQHATHQAQVASQVSSFLASLFEGTSPEQVTDQIEGPSVRHLLDQAVERLATELPDQPETRSRLLTTFGSAYLSLGLYDRSEELLREGLQLRDEVFGQDSLEFADGQERLSNLLRQGRGRRDEVLALNEHILEIRERHLGPDHPKVAQIALHLGGAYTISGHYDEAKPLLDRALKSYEEHLGPKHPTVARALLKQAIFHSAQARFDLAVAAMERALEIQEQHFGHRHTQLIHTLSNLSIIYRHQRRFNAAERAVRRALEICQHEFGEGHPQTAQMLVNLGNLLVTAQRFDDAESFLQRGLELLEDKAQSPFYAARPLAGLGTIARHRGDLDQAERHYRRALDLWREWRSGKPVAGAALSGLAFVRSRQGRLKEAEELFQRALAAQEKKSPEHPEMARVLTDWADFLRSVGRVEEAEAAAQRSQAIYARHDG